MCTFKDERTVMVCDVAIGRVQKELRGAFGDRVRFTPADGQGTLVEAEPTVDDAQFVAIAQASITASQAAERGLNVSSGSQPA